MTARDGTEEYAANLALGHLRQPAIAALTDANDRARAVKTYFAAARDAALRLRWWNFATGWNSPAKAAGVVRPGPLPDVYPLPADCLLVRFVQDAVADDWAVEAVAADPSGSGAEVSCLVTRVSAPLICYTRAIEAVRLWDPDFLLADSYQLAALAGGQLGASSTRIKELQAQADKWRDDGAQVDAQEKAPQQVSRDTSWTRARRPGGSRGRY